MDILLSRSMVSCLHTTNSPILDALSSTHFVEGPHLGGDISIHTSAGINDTHPTHYTNTMIYASNSRGSSIFSSIPTLCASHDDREFIGLLGLMTLPIGMGIAMLH